MSVSKEFFQAYITGFVAEMNSAQRQAWVRCKSDHAELIAYVNAGQCATQGKNDHCIPSRHALSKISELIEHETVATTLPSIPGITPKQNIRKGFSAPESETVAKFSLVLSPCEDLWITDSVEIEFKIPKLYPADPPTLCLTKEPSARSLIARSTHSSLSIDAQTGAITSKLLNANNWSRSYGFCPVYHDVRRFFEIPMAELLDGAIYQHWQSSGEAIEHSVLWKTNMFSHELQGLRATMEDQISLVDNICPGRETTQLKRRDTMGNPVTIEAPVRFAAVFDGHGGPGAAQYFARALPRLIGDEIGRGARAPKAMYTSMFKCDRRFLETTDEVGEHDPSGSTCSCVLIDAIGRCLVGNVGDSRTILCRGTDAVELTRDHKATSPSELSRTVEMGGFVSNNRLMGQLAVGRALGDRAFKQTHQTVLSCEPDIQFCQLKAGDAFFLLACDGLFDVCTSQEAVTFCHKKLRAGLDPSVVCKELGEHAIKLGSRDNVSVALVMLSQMDTFERSILSGVHLENELERREVVADAQTDVASGQLGDRSGGVASLSLLSNWDGPSDADLKEMEDMMNDAMLSPSPVKQGGNLVVKNRKTKDDVDDAAGNTTKKNASNVMGLDDDTFDFLMDSTNFDD